MKKYLKEIVILICQLLMFYIFPLSWGPTDVMGGVLIIVIATLVFSTVITIISDNKIKYLYPIVISILFIPSVFIYYNSSALVHALWYLVISFVGEIIGIGLNYLFKFLGK